MTMPAVAVAWGALVAASLLAGAVAAAWLGLPRRVSAMVTTLGGGILLAAVALELLPEADKLAGPSWTVVGLLAGAFLYVGADAWLARNEEMAAVRRMRHAAACGVRSRTGGDPAEAARGRAIAAGIVVDGVPESLALGLMAAQAVAGPALLLAVLVGNLTESYGAARPIVTGGASRASAVALLGGIGLGLGAVVVLGGTVAAGLPATAVGVAQALAAGAVVAVLSISVLPYAFREASRPVAVVATAGLALGYLLGA
ncbi:MAG TPA: hypothetical protein VFR74_05150 [Jiangellales bacterium]|nr:hypothetical protein [Jiangellales bacterium]